MSRQILAIAVALAAMHAPASDQTEDAVKPGSKLTLTIDGVEFVFCYIPAGTFMMGSPEDEVGRGEGEKLHRVTISRPFYMMEDVITQKQFAAVIGKPPYGRGIAKCAFKGDAQPLENQQFLISEAKTVCDRMAEATGKKFRLPTEAEWEYACRAGTTTPFCYGKDLDWTMANFDGHKPYGNGAKGKMRNRTTEVKQFKPNAWGLYDMHGNVGQLCVDHAVPGADLYTDGVIDPGAADPRFISAFRHDATAAYFPDKIVNPNGRPSRGKTTFTLPGLGGKPGDFEADPKKVLFSRQIVRGGSYNVGASECRSASKVLDYAAAVEADYIGFRLVLIP